MIPALIGGAASLLGGVLANQASARSAQAQMDFQHYMSNTAHQREVADLRAAGLNPILSAGGRGATTPGGSQYTASDVLTPAVSSAGQFSRVQAEAKEINQRVDANLPAEQRDQMRADIWQKNVDSNLKLEQQWKTAQERLTEIERTKNMTTDTELKRSLQLQADALSDKLKLEAVTEKNRPALIAAETHRASARGTADTLENVGRAIEADIDRTAYGRATRYIDRSGDIIDKAISAHRAGSAAKSAASAAARAAGRRR